LSNATGGFNAANGAVALYSNTTGNFNTATGTGALFNNTTGSNNVALGATAGIALTTGSNNVCIGAGVNGVAGESNTTRIRNIYTTVANGRAVYVNADNKIGTLSSSRRFKEDIQPMDCSSETLFALKPVTFRYKKDADPSQALSFGLIAEDVAQVSPELITRDEQGKPQTVRYEAVNAMLLNEFLKEHRKVDSLEKAMVEQRRENAAIRALLKEQAAQMQKVSAQLEVSKATPQTVVNNQ
jgi:trimeric autotransporter adhesin